MYLASRRALFGHGFRVVGFGGAAGFSWNGCKYNCILVDRANRVVPWVKHGNHDVAGFNFKKKRYLRGQPLV